MQIMLSKQSVLNIEVREIMNIDSKIASFLPLQVTSNNKFDETKNLNHLNATMCYMSTVCAILYIPIHCNYYEIT